MHGVMYIRVNMKVVLLVISKVCVARFWGACPWLNNVYPIRERIQQLKMK